MWTREKYLNLYFKKQCIQQESTFFKKSLYEKAGSFINLNYKYASDLELWVRFFRYEKLYTVNTILGGFRIHQKQKTSWYMKEYISEGEKIVNEEIELMGNGYFEHNPEAPEILTFNEDSYSRFLDFI